MIDLIQQGQRLKERRIAMGLTKADIVEITKIPIYEIIYLETGQISRLSNPDCVAEAISQAYDEMEKTGLVDTYQKIFEEAEKELPDGREKVKYEKKEDVVDWQSVKDKIDDYIEFEGITRDRFAKESAMTPQTLHRFLNNPERRLSVDNLVRIADGMDTWLDELLGRI